MVSRLMIAGLVVFTSAAFAQTGPCSEHAIRQTRQSNVLAPRTADMYFYSGALDKPVVGGEQIAATGKQVASGRKNQKESLQPDKIVVAEDGQMAYEYGTGHVSYDDVKSGKHEAFSTAYLAVWKTDGGQCKVAATMAEPTGQKK